MSDTFHRHNDATLDSRDTPVYTKMKVKTKMPKHKSSMKQPERQL